MSTPPERIKFYRPDLFGTEAVIADHVVPQSIRMLHENYLVTVAWDGSVDWKEGGRRHTAVRGTTAFMEPGEFHMLDRFNTPTVTQRLLFLPSSLVREAAAELRGGSSEVHLTGHHSADPPIYRAFTSLHRALEGEATKLECQSLFWNGLGVFLERHVEKEPMRPGTGRESAAVRRAVDYLEDHYAKNLGLDELAGAAGLGKFNLIRTFKAALGLAPHAYLIQTRLRRARLLLQRGEPLAQVAASVGFCDQSHLTRCFRSSLGVTPGEYSRQLFRQPRRRRGQGWGG